MSKQIAVRMDDKDVANLAVIQTYMSAKLDGEEFGQASAIKYAIRMTAERINAESEIPMNKALTAPIRKTGNPFRNKQ